MPKNLTKKSHLKMKTFCGLKCSVTPHKSYNTSKGIVCCPALIRQSNEHILEFMEEQGVTDDRRINVHRDCVLKPTNTFVFTFNTPELPTVVKIGFIQAKVDVYVPNPLRCYQCQVSGHHENKCGRQAFCINCGMPEHCASGQRQRPAKCVNCSGDHPANSKECPQSEKEKKILKIKCEQNISFPEARKQYEQFYQARTYASAVKPGTCNKSTETDNKTTQTDDSFTEQQTQEKQQEPPKGKSPKKGNPSPLSFVFLLFSSIYLSLLFSSSLLLSPSTQRVAGLRVCPGRDGLPFSWGFPLGGSFLLFFLCLLF